MNEFIKKVYKRLKNPNALTLFLVYFATALFITASLLMLTFDFESGGWAIVAYVSFALAAIFLAYSTYTIVIFAPGLKGRIVAFLESHEFTRRMIKNWGFRTIVTATVSLAMGIAYAIFNAILGISARSIWYGALAAYYIMLVLMRGGLLLYHKRSKDFESEADIRIRNYGRSGVLLLILNLALSSAIAQMIFDDRSFEYKDWFIYAFAAYAFYKIIMSVYNAIKARRQTDMTIQAIRDINLVDAAVSILALQTALLHTFSTDGAVNISLFNTLTGSAVSIFSIGLSIFMIVKATRLRKETEGVTADGKSEQPESK